MSHEHYEYDLASYLCCAITYDSNGATDRKLAFIARISTSRFSFNISILQRFTASKTGVIAPAFTGPNTPFFIQQTKNHFVALSI